GESGMSPVGIGKLGPLQWDGPVDPPRRVRKVAEFVRLPGCRRPMIVDQIGIRRLLSQSLIGVPDATWYEDRCFGAHLQGETATKAIPSTQIDPDTEDPPGCQRHQLVPRFGVNAPGRASSVVERDVVLHRLEIWQPE